MYRPLELPDVDTVDVYGLRGSDPPRVGEFMRHLARCAWVRLDGEGAAAVAGLYRQLPGGETMRCHTPPFGLRFWSNGELITEASLCWECNNAFGFRAGERIAFDFEGQSDIAQVLLTLLRRTMREGLGYG